MSDAAIRAVLFDIGGVLEVTPGTGWRARWEERLGLPEESLDDALGHVWAAGSLGRISLADAEREIASALGLGPEALREFMADLWEDYLGHLDEPLMAFFASLRPRFTTGILSNSFVGAREREEELYGFASICDQVVYSHEIGVAKPDPESYRRACAALGVDPAACVFVDDVPEYLEGAASLGIRGVHHTDTPATLATLRELLGVP